MFCCCFGRSKRPQYDKVDSAVLIKKLFIVGTTRGLQAYQVIEADGKVFLNTIWEPLALAREPSDFEVTSDRNLVFVSHLEGSITTVLFNHSASMKQLTSYNTKGLGTTSVAVDKQMRFVLATNYDSGSGVVFKLIENDKLELFNLLQYEDPSNVVKERQNASHPSCFTLDPKEKFAYVTDLGGDTLIQYEFHSSKGPQPDSAKFLPLNPGCGPSQIAFHPDYHTLYVSCELSNEIVVVSLEESNMRVRQVVTTLGRIKSQSEYLTGEIHLTPNGSYLYASVRGNPDQTSHPDHIAAYRVNPDGTLQPLAQESSRGKNPKSFALDPSGQLLLVANRDSHNLVPFKIQPDGTLELCGDIVALDSLISVKFIPL